MTALDHGLAAAFFAVLVDIARTGGTTTYEELIRKAAERDPNVPGLAAAIPRGVGRRLDAMRDLTRHMKWPDLASLVVTKRTGEVGSAYAKAFDPEAERQKVYAFDWSEVEWPDTPIELQPGKAPITVKQITRDEARAMMAAFAKANQPNLSATASAARDEIIELLLCGHGAEEAFELCGALKYVWA